MNEPTPKFNPRAFASMGLVLTTIALPVTGYANHVYQFAGMTVSRHAWMGAHYSLGVVFTGFAVWHFILNRRILLQHVRGAASRAASCRRELLGAVAIVAITTALAAGHAFLVPSP